MRATPHNAHGLLNSISATRNKTKRGAMISYTRWLLVGIVAMSIVAGVRTHSAVAKPLIPSESDRASDTEIQTARDLGLLRSRQAGRNWVKNKTCVSCHHQTLPILAEVEATKAGGKADPEWLKTQAEVAHTYLEERIELMNASRHLPGGSTTAGFSLWAMMLDHRPADETTEATVAYLLKMQGLDRLVSSSSSKQTTPAKPKPRLVGPWLPSCSRPPLTSSRIGNTVVVLKAMKAYATKSQRAEVEKATQVAEEWLAHAPLQSTEDHVWRLWGLELLGGSAPKKEELRTALIRLQNKDGGWSQISTMSSDAYATGQVLYILLKTGTSRDDEVARRAATYLVRTQANDGSWIVTTRVKSKAQPYFDNGDPYGEHQFLSVAASSWATAALSVMSAKNPSSLER